MSPLWGGPAGRIRRTSEGLILKNGRGEQSNGSADGFQQLDGAGFFRLAHEIDPAIHECGWNGLDGMALGNFPAPFGVDVDFLVLKRDIVSQGLPERFGCRTTGTPVGVDDRNLGHSQFSLMQASRADRKRRKNLRIRKVLP